MEEHQIFPVAGELESVYRRAIPGELVPEDPILFGALNTAGNEVSGVLALTDYEGVWQIRYIEVADKFRRQGIGRQMVSLAISYLQAAMGEVLSFSYARRIPPTEETEVLEAFFLALGFHEEQRTDILRFRLKHVKNSMAKARSFSGRILSLEEVSIRQWRALSNCINEEGSREDRRGKGVFIEIGEPWNHSAALSALAFSEDGEPLGAFLANYTPEGEVMISYIYVPKGTKESVGVVSHMVAKSLGEAKKMLDRDTYIYANVQNSTLQLGLMKSIVGAKVEPFAESVELVKAL